MKFLQPTTYNLQPSAQRGAAAVYMALLIATLVLSSALIFNTILTREIRLGRTVASSERAFAAANTGYEHALYNLAILGETTTEGEGEIQYNGERATYIFEGKTLIEGDTRFACVLAAGTYRDETRRLITGPAECDLISS